MEKGKIYVGGILYSDGAVGDRVTDMQEYTAWLDNFVWSGKSVWHEKNSGGGGGGDVDAKVLKTMPTFMARGLKAGDKVYFVSHPMMNDDGAEIVLLHYAKKNGKKRGWQTWGRAKKGYCIASGGNAGHEDYFTFSAETSNSELYDFLDTQGINCHRHFGIALRIPNPDYTGPATYLKNATYKGVPESLYSDVLPIRIAYDGSADTYGIGVY